MIKSLISPVYLNLFCFTILFSLIKCNNSNTTRKAERGEYIEIERFDIKIGILPDVGGRIVLLTKGQSKNIIKSDTLLWNEPISERPKASILLTEWKPYNGHIIWLGPQAEWWAQQDHNIEKKTKKAQWPPDPFLVYGNFEINKKSPFSVLLKGPESEVSGIQLIKEATIKKDSTILIKTIAKNISDKKVCWDLWFNTRMNGFCRCYVPASENNCRINVDEWSDPIPFFFIDGYFSFNPQLAISKEKRKSTKAFIYPDKGFIAGFTKENLFLIRFQLHDREDIHPGQGLVEIYNSTTTDSINSLLELEYHSPYKALNPGAKMEAYEIWEVYDYSGPNNTKGHLQFLEKKIH